MVIKKISGIILILFVYFLIPTAVAEECTSCHKIRHGLTGDFCDNCHYNTTLSNGKHIQKPFSPGFVHDSFDWEGDNANASHSNKKSSDCIDCHVNGELKSFHGKEVVLKAYQYKPILHSKTITNNF